MDASDVAAMIGVLAIAVGLAMVSIPLALVAGGAFLVLGAVATSSRRKAPTDG
jgi:hypothetical protein